MSILTMELKAKHFLFMFTPIVLALIYYNTPTYFVVYEGEDMTYEINDSLIQEGGYRGTNEKELIVTEAIFRNKKNNNKSTLNIFTKKEDCLNQRGVISYTYVNGELFRDFEFDFREEKHSSETIAAARMCMVFNSARN